MAQEQNQIYGYSSAIYFHSPPFPPQNYQSPPQNEQSNSRKRPRILGGNRGIKEPVGEKKIEITEENLIEVEKIMAADLVENPHPELQTAYDPFMGNVTDTDEEEAALSDDELEEIEEESYVILSKKRDLLHLYSRVPPPYLGEMATAMLPEPWLRMLDLGTSRTPIPNGKQKIVNSEQKKVTIRRRFMKFSKKPSASKPKTPEPSETPPRKKDSQTYTWFSPSTASTPMPSVLIESPKPPPRRVSDLEDINNLRTFLNENAPIEVVERENEQLDKVKRQKKGVKPGGVLMEMLKDDNSL